MKHILVATDLSPRADRAVDRAFHLAAESGAALTVISITDDAMPDRLVEVMSTETKNHLKAHCDRLADETGKTYSTAVRQGDPSTEIPEIASEVGADLIVLGLHRKRQFFDTIRETTLERVVRHCAHPVLLVRELADEAYQTILAAADFSPASTAAINAAHAIAPGASLHGLHVVHVPVSVRTETDPRADIGVGFVRDAEDARDRWMDISPLPPTLPAPEIKTGGLTSVFDAEIARLRPDLIAVGAHARFSLTHPVLGSFARELLRHPPADILIAKPAKKKSSAS